MRMTDAEIREALPEVTAFFQSNPEPLTEKRVREIIREELAAWEKRQVQQRRFGIPVRGEVN